MHVRRHRARQSASALTQRPGRFVLLVLAILLATLPAGAQESIDDARTDRERNRQEQREIAREINLLEADRAEILAVLDEMDQVVGAQIARVDTARQKLVAADADAAVYRQELEATEAERAALGRTAADLAVEAYIGGGGRNSDIWFEAEDVDVASRRSALMRQVQGDLADAVDRLAGLEEDRGLLAERAQSIVLEAEAIRQEIAIEVAVLERDRNQQLELEAALSAKIDNWETQAQALDREEEELTSFIRSRQLATVVSSAGLSAASAEGFVRPIDARPGSPFGNRRHPILGVYRLHAGVDFGAPTGTPIWAAKEGKVISAGWRGGYGRTVLVEHSGGVTTLYAHMSKITTSVGAFVGRGEVIGLVGSTGQSTGPHLHFETRIAGKAKDPMLLID